MNKGGAIATSAATQKHKSTMQPVETDVANIIDDFTDFVTVSRKDEKGTVFTRVIPALSEVIDKLTGPNFLEWSKMVRIYLRSMSMYRHLIDDPPKDDDEEWLQDDAKLFLLVKNCIDSEIVGLISHCEYVKEVMEYLESIYANKNNNFRKYEACKKCFRAQQRKGQSLQSYFVEMKKAYDELMFLFPFSSDIQAMHTREEQIGVLCFLAGLGDQFEIARSQILSNAEIPSFDEVYTMLHRVEVINSISPSAEAPGAHVSRNVGLDRIYESQNRGDNRSSYTRVVCYYCHEPGHTKRSCYKLQKKAQRSRSDAFNDVGKSGSYEEYFW